jgi:hypothetical protein
VTRRPPGRLAGALALCLAGCAARGPEVPTAQVALATFQVVVPARGQLEAARATPVTVPEVPAALSIAWLASDGSRVASGEVVARFDDEGLRRQLDDAEREAAKIDLDIRVLREQQSRERGQVERDLAQLDQEMEQARTFQPRDAAVFSRFEIIDAQLSLEGLAEKRTILVERRARQLEKQRADMQLLELKRRTQETRIAQLARAKSSLEIAAPHDGFFLHGRNWRGERFRVGMPAWGGMKIGELPDLTAMEAKVHVLESEATGLAPGQAARIEVDAAPGRSFDAKVKTVEAVAQALDTESPVKFFQVVLALDLTDGAVMRPGREVTARIVVERSDGTVSVPNQALFRKGGDNWVFVAGGGGFEKRAVRLGARGLTRTVVVAGLAAGERVALSEPGA